MRQSSACGRRGSAGARRFPDRDNSPSRRLPRRDAPVPAQEAGTRLRFPGADWASPPGSRLAETRARARRLPAWLWFQPQAAVAVSKADPVCLKPDFMQRKCRGRPRHGDRARGRSAHARASRIDADPRSPGPHRHRAAGRSVAHRPYRPDASVRAPAPCDRAMRPIANAKAATNARRRRIAPARMRARLLPEISMHCARPSAVRMSEIDRRFRHRCRLALLCRSALR